MTPYRSGLGVRGDHLYCPLAFGLDLYWGCEFDCSFCFCRGLNRTWGREIRAVDVGELTRKLLSPGKGTAPEVRCAEMRKTLRLGNKSDWFQPEAEARFGRPALQMLRVLRDAEWSVKVETRGQLIGEPPYFDLIADMKAAVTVSVMIGGSDDWKKFHPQSADPLFLLTVAGEFRRRGHQVSVITEPFLPGYHTTAQFITFLDVVKSVGLDAVNVYNLHLTEFVAKRIYNLPGVDIERIWVENQDDRWGCTLLELIQIAESKGIYLGMPDFVNSGRYLERFNTCCAVAVPNPLRYNYPTFKRHILRKGSLSLEDLHDMYEGIGPSPEELFADRRIGRYGLHDMGLVRRGDLWVFPESVPPEPERRAGSGGRRRS
jgi:DNA repair photolyase